MQRRVDEEMKIASYEGSAAKTGIHDLFERPYRTAHRDMNRATLLPFQLPTLRVASPRCSSQGVIATYLPLSAKVRCTLGNSPLRFSVTFAYRRVGCPCFARGC